jgi:hypothetical protein
MSLPGVRTALTVEAGMDLLLTAVNEAGNESKDERSQA